MLIKDQKTRLDIPHEDGQWVEIRRLSWRELDKAREAQQVRAMSAMKSMGGDVLEALRGAQSDGARDARQQSPQLVYDRATVLHAGLVAWSYDEKVTPEHIDQLDPVTADWLFRQIVEQHAESDETKKKDSPPSTAH